MKESRYIISDAAKLVEVEAHVLRYWEVELGLNIMRNELGHRYYTEHDIAMLRKVKKLKEEGVQLKRIKKEIEDSTIKSEKKNIVDFQERFNEGENMTEEKKQLPEKQSGATATVTMPGEKLEQFKIIMGSLISEALRENMGNMSGQVSSDVSNNVLKEMDFLFRENNEKEEERYRMLDETIRSVQKSRQEAAVSELKKKEEKKQKKKWGLRTKKKKKQE